MCVSVLKLAVCGMCGSESNTVYLTIHTVIIRKLGGI